jgi:hypothetical protein
MCGLSSSTRGLRNQWLPDNAKTGVTKACRYDPDLNPTYREMAMHYGVGVVPTRPYKPRDKAKAESGVLLEAPARSSRSGVSTELSGGQGLSPFSRSPFSLAVSFLPCAPHKFF